jgi:beta-phosphoglucomutase-like phosphatase (HAD superfamily)
LSVVQIQQQNYMTIKAVLMGFDGCVADTTGATKAEIRNLCEKSPQLRLEFESWRYEELDFDISALAYALNWRVAELYAHLTIHAARNTGFLTGFPQFLRFMEERSLDWGIASDECRQKIQLFLQLKQETAISHPVIVTVEDLVVGKVGGKPAPYLYEKLIFEMRLQADEVIVLESCPDGVLSASRAGVPINRIFGMGSVFSQFEWLSELSEITLVNDWMEVASLFKDF